MATFDYVKPHSLGDLVSDLAHAGSKGAVLAGGTDLLVKIRSGLVYRRVLFDINDLEEIRGISDKGDGLQIGAATPISEIASSDLVQYSVPSLSVAASELGSPQIRKRATLGGNIITASPAADTLPPLIAMGARLKVRGIKGERQIPIQEFLKGPGKTDIHEGEILTEVLVPKLKEGCRSHFIKVGRRKAMAISVVNMAGWIQLGRGSVIEDVRLVLGAVAPTAIRAREAESFLKGKGPTEVLLKKAAVIAEGEVEPISDIRGTDKGRRLLVRAWTFRLLEILTGLKT